MYKAIFLGGPCDGFTMDCTGKEPYLYVLRAERKPVAIYDPRDYNFHDVHTTDRYRQILLYGLERDTNVRFFEYSSTE